MLVYICVPGVFIGVNVTGIVLSSERGEHESSRYGHAHAAVVCGIVYRHHGNGTLFLTVSAPTPDRHRLPVAQATGILL